MEPLNAKETESSQKAQRARLLFVDDDPEVSKSYQLLLSKQGFQVTCASSPNEAKQMLEQSYFHMAIMDRRLTSSDDTEDNSGIELALDPLCEGLPVILVSGDLSKQAMRTVIKIMSEAKVRFVDALDKNDIVTLLESLDTFFQTERRNWDLFIQQEPVSIGHVAAALLDRGSPRRWEGICNELEDLFQNLFQNYLQVRIEKILWADNGLTVLSMVCFSSGNPPEHKLLTVGLRKRLERYIAGFEELKRFTTTSGIRVHQKAQATRLVAVSFGPHGLPAKHMNLTSCYANASRQDFHKTLSILAEETLPGWIGDTGMPFDPKLTGENWQLDTYIRHFRTQGQRYLDALRTQAPRLDIQLRADASNITMTYQKQSITWPNPFTEIQDVAELQNPLKVFHTSGRLTGENLVTNKTDGIWVTDFSRSCKAPLSYPYAQIEALIRIDWFDDPDPGLHLELENILEQHSFLDLPTGHKHEAVSKALSSIGHLRKLIADKVADRHQEYHIALLAQMLEKLWAYDSKCLLPDHRLVQLIHLFVAICNLTRRILNKPDATTQNQTAPTLQPGLVLDEAKRKITINGKQQTLRGLGWKMLVYLYQRSGEVVSREELGQELYGPNFEVSSSSDTVKLNTAVNRLRSSIEPDPSAPRFLITEQGEGYLLITNPD